MLACSAWAQRTSDKRLAASVSARFCKLSDRKLIAAWEGGVCGEREKEMAEHRSDNMTAEMEEEGLTILQKIEDMEVYALPLIERWSIAHQKLLGDDIAHCMNRMSQLASALTVAYYKKTSISELDEMNKALQSHIRVAYRLGYLKGKSSRSEWEGRSAEIGRMIGKYKEWVYGDQKSSQQNKSAKSRYSR